MNTKLSVIILIPILAILIGCSNTDSVSEGYESQWFSYPDSTYRNRIDVCKVKYYVGGNIIYTSEKYHFLTLAYSWDCDNTLAYQHIVFFDKSQERDAGGWYTIVINRDDIPREPDTHLSGIVLRNYIGDKYTCNTGDPHADAYLYNSSLELSAGKDRNTLSPQLTKLLPIIR